MLKFKIEQIGKSLLNFIESGDEDNLLDIWRIAMWKEEING